MATVRVILDFARVMRNPVRPTARRLLSSVLVVGLVGACAGSADDAGTEDRPTVVVTTNILGDVVSELVGGEAEVVTIMPVGADPHEFQASAQQVDEIQRADVVILNGGGFEENLLDVLEAAEADGVPTFDAFSAVESLEFVDHEDHGGEEAEHDHGGEDPHFFTDPDRMAAAAAAIGDFLVANLDGVDAEALGSSVDGYVAALGDLDAEVSEILAVVPAERRVLITNHEVFGYFADRYGFEVVGAIIPSGSTADGADAAALAALAEEIEHEGVPAIFADTSSSDELVRTLAEEVGDVEVVELFSESLGEQGSEGATYVEMIRANAERIAGALA